MIDNYDQAMELVRKMEAALPIPARPASALARLAKEKDLPIAPGGDLHIEKVFYSGDEGGIVCGITPPGAEEAVVVSLTHLRVHPRHPLADEIRAYQNERTRRLVRSGGSSQPHSTRLDRNKRRRR